MPDPVIADDKIAKAVIEAEFATAAARWSDAGATIVGAMLMGADKRSATEFSFYLAMPTMAGAFAKDLLDNYKYLSGNDVGLIVIGFIVSFVSALFVVRFLLDYVSTASGCSRGGGSSSAPSASPA